MPRREFNPVRVTGNPHEALVRELHDRPFAQTGREVSLTLRPARRVGLEPQRRGFEADPRQPNSVATHHGPDELATPRDPKQSRERQRRRSNQGQYRGRGRKPEEPLPLCCSNHRAWPEAVLLRSKR